MNLRDEFRSPLSSRLTYKRKRRRRGWRNFESEFSIKKSLEIPEKVDVGYYSGGEPNHFKTIVLIIFLTDSSRYIAAS